MLAAWAGRTRGAELELRSGNDYKSPCIEAVYLRVVTLRYVCHVRRREAFVKWQSALEPRRNNVKPIESYYSVGFSAFLGRATRPQRQRKSLSAATKLITSHAVMMIS